MKNAKSARFVLLGHRPDRTPDKHQCIRTPGPSPTASTPFLGDHRPEGAAHTKGRDVQPAIQQNRQTEPKFKTHRHVPDPTVWNQRRARLLGKIKILKADVICVQELDKPDHDGDFCTTIKEQGYKSTFKKRKSNLVHGFAIFHRNDR
ncbi:hypothetical protein BGZ72_009577 [Mortierella alpina]|nr:hypothetical protein BGZ72_009577 [Mortierella alpina]